jgi:hypothetical protein
MIASEPTSPGGRPSPADDAVGPGAEGSEVPLTRLRGATVDIDPGRAKRVVVSVCLMALAVVAVILLIAGVQKNSQAVTLHQHGVRVDVTVVGCLGLLGGSGSNGAGYACKGTYSFDGHRYTQSIPGNARRAPGSVIMGVIVPSTPGLLSTPGLVAEQQASWKVFIAPIVLFVVLALALVLIALVRRRARRAAGELSEQE